jgi:hypothetical protein
MASAPEHIHKHFCRECKTTDVSSFSLKSYDCCRKCKRELKGKKYFCSICFTEDIAKFTQGRYSTCKQCRYKPDLEAIKENMHKAVLEGKIVIKDGIVHPVPSAIGVSKSFFKSKKDKKRKRDDESESDDSSDSSSSPGRDFEPPNPREKMNMIMEAENVKQASLVGTFGSKQSQIAGIFNTKQASLGGSIASKDVGELRSLRTEGLSEASASISSCGVKQASRLGGSFTPKESIIDETFIVNQIEKYLCFNENVFGVSFKSILENITQYNLQKDEYDIKRDEEIQFLREEIARLKYLLHES